MWLRSNSADRSGPANGFAWWCYGLLIWLAVAAYGQEPKLDFADITVPPTAEIEFKESRFKEAPDVSPEETPRAMIEAATPSYKLFVDMTAVSFDDLYLTGYSFPVYVVAKSGSRPTLRFKVKAEVVGSLQDSVRPVGFTIGPEGSGESGSLRLPVYSPNPAPYVEVSHPALFEARLGEEGRFPITLTNRLDGLPTRLRILGPIGSRADLWADIHPSAPHWSNDGIELAPKAEQKLFIQARARTVPALLHGFLPAPRSDPHDVLSLSLEYQTLGGRSVVVPMEIPVRFVPSSPFLIVVLLASAVLAQLVVLLLRRPTLSRWLRVLVAVVVVSVVSWIAAIGLYEANSRLQIFGLEVNPLEIPGTVLIGFLVGLSGSKVLKLFETIIGRRGQGEADGPGGES